MEDTFLPTVLGLAAVTLVGTFISGRMRDRCLKDFDGFAVTLESTDGKTVWGTLDVLTTGIELTYLSDHLDRDHVESSFLLYKEEFDSRMFLLARYHTDLDERDRKTRDKVLSRTYRPNVLRRALRSAKNATNTIKDSLNKLVSLAVGQATRTARRGTALIAVQQDEFAKAGQQVIGYVGTSYDPMLEKRVGTKVVFELNREGAVHEFVGILKEYSSAFIEILDVEYPSRFVATVPQRMPTLLVKDVICNLSDGLLEVRNKCPDPITVETVVVGEEAKSGGSVTAGATWRMEVPAGCAQVEVHARWVRKADLILPRSRAIVRHQSERIRQRKETRRGGHTE